MGLPRGMTLNELIDDSWHTAEEKGWHSLATRSFVEELALFHSELSEALQEVRDGHVVGEIYFNQDPAHDVCTAAGEILHKPEGVPVELADVLIRICDTCKARGIDLERALQLKAEYNRHRPHLHGGKKL